MLEFLNDLLWSKVLIVVLVLWGSQQDLSTVFAFADVAIGLLGLVNLVALALLFKVGLRVMRDYDQQAAAGAARPVFDANQFSDLAIDRAAWVIEPEAGLSTVAAWA